MRSIFQCGIVPGTGNSRVKIIALIFVLIIQCAEIENCNVIQTSVWPQPSKTDKFLKRFPSFKGPNLIDALHNLTRNDPLSVSILEDLKTGALSDTPKIWTNICQNPIRNFVLDMRLYLSSYLYVVCNDVELDLKRISSVFGSALIRMKKYHLELMKVACIIIDKCAHQRLERLLERNITQFGFTFQSETSRMLRNMIYPVLNNNMEFAKQDVVDMMDQVLLLYLPSEKARIVCKNLKQKIEKV